MIIEGEVSAIWIVTACMVDNSNHYVERVKRYEGTDFDIGKIYARLDKSLENLLSKKLIRNYEIIVETEISALNYHEKYVIIDKVNELKGGES